MKAAPPPASWLKSALAATILAICAPTTFLAQAAEASRSSQASAANYSVGIGLTQGTDRAILLAYLSEETLPPVEMTVTGGSPTATPAPTATAMPPSAAGQPPSSDFSIFATPQPTPSSNGPSAEPVEGEAGEPPPIDLGTSATLQVSELPLTRLIDNSPTPARAASLRLTEQARQEISGGKAAEAIQSLTRALSIDSSSPYAYFYLGRAYLLKKDYRQALTFLQRAEIGFASDQTWLGETLSFEGACYEQLGQTTEAIAAYRRALDSSPYNLMARVGYGRLATSGRPESGATPGVGGPESQPEPPPAMPEPEGAPSESPAPLADPQGR